MKGEKPQSSSQYPVGRRPDHSRRRARAFLSSSGYWILASGFFLLPGCGDGKPAESGYDRSEKALHDPMHYSPYSTGERKSDMSGARGGTTPGAGKDPKDPKDAKDPKDVKDAAAGGAAGAGKDDAGTSDWDGLKRDLKHVFDP